MKIFFALVVSLTAGICSSFAQPENDVKWFETTFRPRTGTVSEKELSKKQNEISVAAENNDPHRRVRLEMELGAIHLIPMRDREKAMALFIDALSMEDSLRLDQEKVFTLLAIGRVFEGVLEFDRSLEYINQALQLNEDFKNPDLSILVLKEAGRILTKRGDNDVAVEKYQQILTYARQWELKDQEAAAMYHLGRLYMFAGDYPKALEFHKKALVIQRSLKSRREEAQTLNSFADLYLLMKNTDRSMANQQATLEIRTALGDAAGMAYTYNRIGDIYFGQKDFSKAIANFQSALKWGLEAQQQEEIKNSYNKLSNAYKEIKDYSKALEYKELFIAIDDFIRNENSSLQLADAQNRYRLLQKEKEISQLETARMTRDKVIEDQEKLQTLLFAIIGLVVIIVGLVSYLYFVKIKLARSLKEVNDAKDKLFSIIGHDIKGPLNSLMSFASLLKDHGDVISKEEIKMLSTDLDKSLKNLTALLENLLQWARSQSGNMEFKRDTINISTLLNDNKQLLKAQADAKGIAIESNYADSLMAKANANSINTVIRNLLSNAIKFTPSNGVISLRADDNGDMLLVSVNDSGVGIDSLSLAKLFKVGTKHSTLGTAKEKGTGLGLILCKEFVEKNGGTIGVSSKPGEGSQFYFTIPVR